MRTLTRHSTPEECQAYFEEVEVERGMEPFPYNIEEVYQLKYSLKAHAVRAVKRDYPNDWEEHRNGRKIEVWISHHCFSKLFGKMKYPVEDWCDVAETDILSIPTDDNHISSIEIASIVKKSHKHILEDIRSMEPAWQNVCGSKFRLTSGEVAMPNGGTRQIPCYILDKKECLYIATKYDNLTRAKLIQRWEDVERQLAQQQTPLTPTQALLQSVQLLADLEQRQISLEQKLNTIEQNQRQAEQELFAIELSSNVIPEISLRTKVVTAVAKFAECEFPTDPEKYRKAWRYFYDELLKRYHFRAYEDKSRNYTKLDDVEQRGHLQALFDIVSDTIRRKNYDKD